MPASLGVLASEVEDVVERVASVLALGPEVVLALQGEEFVSFYY